MKSSILWLPAYYSLVFSCCWSSVFTCYPSKMEKDKEPESLSTCRSGVCMPLKSCISYLHKLSAGGPNGRKEVLKNTCGIEGNRLKVCCPSQEPYVDFFPENCGFSKIIRRVLGGKKAILGQFPWMAAFYYEASKEEGSSIFQCAGSVINTRYVLTAAHCLKENSTELGKLSFIRLGEFDFSSKRDCMNTTRKSQCAPLPIDAKAEKVILHPDYAVSSEYAADIALIRLDRTIDLKAADGYIAPICLPPLGFHAEYEARGRNLTAVGWGATLYGTKDNSKIPLYVHLPIVEHKICEKRLKKFLRKSQVEKSQLCAGGVEDEDTCYGDSGGPLMLLGELGEPYLQVGITSFGIQCGTENLPGVYTTVSHYIDWIATSMEPW